MVKLIPDDFIRDIIARTNIVDIVSRHVKLKKKGNNYFGCCPFHNEKTASFCVNEKKQFFHCFGCGVSGSVIEFLKQIEHLSFPETMEELAVLHGLEVPYTNTDKNSDKGSLILRNIRADIYQLMNTIAHYYHTYLKQSDTQQAQAYLTQRGIDKQTIDRFNIGFAPNGWQTTSKKFVHSKEMLTVYDQAGMLVTNDQGQQYDRFRGRVMFPIRDRQGNIVAFGGRSINNSEPKYLNSPETSVFHKSRILYGLYEVLKKHHSPQKLLIVEGYMDVISLAQFGIDYAVASLGTATTSEQLQLLFRSTDHVICCYDGDTAGRRAAWRTLTTALPILSDDKQLQFLFLPDNEDPDSLVRKEGKTHFETRLTSAQTLAIFLFDTLTKQTNLTTPEGRAKLSALAVPLINQVNAKVLNLYLKEQLGFKLNILNQIEFNKLFITHTQEEQPAHWQPKLKLTTMRILIGLLVQYPNELSPLIANPNELLQCKVNGVELLVELLKLCHHYPGITTAQLLESFRENKFFHQLETLATWNHMYEDTQLESIFLNTLRELYDTILTERFNQLIAKDKNEGLTSTERKEVHAINIALSKK